MTQRRSRASSSYAEQFGAPEPQRPSAGGDVATLLPEGLSYAQIAQELVVTHSDVAFHLSNVYAKTGTASRPELVQLQRRVQP